MPWGILCPGCGVVLIIDDDGKSLPDAEFKFIDKAFCGNCGRDMTASLTRAVNEIIPNIKKQKNPAIKNPPQRQ